MDRNAYRDDNDTDQPDAYWRRRVITLVAGLSLLGLLAWAFSGGGGKPASTAPKNPQASGILPAAAYSGTPTSPSPGVGGSSVGGSGSAPAGPAASLPFSSVTPSSGTGQSGRGSAAGKSAGRGPTAGQAGAGSTAPAAASGGGVQPGGGCSPGAVVLSLFSSRPEYYAGQYPVFDVYAVSTASRACSFDVSPARLHVVVMSSGRVIWDSADCTRGEPNRVAELSRGVPAQGSVTWNRTISLPGCVTLASAARPGTYQVQARDAAVGSPVRTFRLVRLPHARSRQARLRRVGPQDGGERLADILHLLHLHEVGETVGALQGRS
jgi:hypothetical protein